ncbi:MAG: FMN-dependent NADH-azoreductase [Myxococcota bacterium]|jgi:FMN-dependent NADH-azoreductase
MPNKTSILNTVRHEYDQSTQAEVVMSDSFHVHVYWSSPTQRAEALALREAASGRFPAAALGRLHEAPFAFHPAPMFQIQLDRIELGTLLTWLHRHRGALSLMVHPLTGDVVEEHLEEAIWLGLPLQLDQQALLEARSAREVQQPAALAPFTILRIDASARRTGSHGRMLADELIGAMKQQHPGAAVIGRDLLGGLPLLDEETIGAFFTEAASRSASQRALLETSEALIGELEQADAVVLSVPIYNFHVPAVLKAWLDLVARARRTFRYTADGPVGMLADRPVYVIVTSGGTRLRGPADFVSGWLRHVLNFIGLKDVHFIEADGLMADAPGRLAAAREQLRAHLDRAAA